MKAHGSWPGPLRDGRAWQIEKEPHPWSVQNGPVISALLVVRPGSGASHACAPEGSQIWTSLNQPSRLTANDWHSQRTSHLLAILYNPTATSKAFLSTFQIRCSPEG